MRPEEGAVGAGAGFLDPGLSTIGQGPHFTR
jgi:hypothetical protein